MKTKYQGKVPRTSGWKSQTDFDILISDLDISSLCFLNDDYKHRITRYCYSHDVEKSKYQKEYIQLLQRKNMLKEELENRWRGIQPEDEYFDSNTGLVVDKHNVIQYGIAFNDEEDGYVYQYLDSETSITTETQEDTELEDVYDGVKIIPIIEGNKVVEYKIMDSAREKKDIYRGWDYFKDIEENE